MKTKRLFLVCIASLAFVSCGGDGGNDNDDGESPVDRMIEEQLKQTFCGDPAFADSAGCQ
jgi:hypothetical protein